LISFFILFAWPRCPFCELLARLPLDPLGGVPFCPFYEFTFVLILAVLTKSPRSPPSPQARMNIFFCSPPGGKKLVFVGPSLSYEVWLNPFLRGAILHHRSSPFFPFSSKFCSSTPLWSFFFLRGGAFQPPSPKNVGCRLLPWKL